MLNFWIAAHSSFPKISRCQLFCCAIWYCHGNPILANRLGHISSFLTEFVFLSTFLESIAEYFFSLFLVQLSIEINLSFFSLFLLTFWENSEIQDGGPDFIITILCCRGSCELCIVKVKWFLYILHITKTWRRGLHATRLVTRKLNACTI